MKKIYFLMIAIFAVANLQAQIINFPDVNLKNRLIQQGVDTNGDSDISINEAELVMALDLSNAQINQLVGLQYFTELGTLDISGNNLVFVDLTALNNLQSLTCAASNVFALNVTGLIQLTSLNCRDNYIQSLDLTGMTQLEMLFCKNNQITTLNNLHHAVALKTLICDQNQLASLNVQPLTQLDWVNCNQNHIQTLDFTNSTNVRILTCELNNLNTLEISDCHNLIILSCSNNNLTEIDMTQKPSLLNLSCFNNSLTSLDLSYCTALQQLSCVGNPNLQTINFKNGVTQNFQANYFFNDTDVSYICADENEITSITTYLSANAITGCEVNSYCTFTPGGNYFAVIGHARFDDNNNGCDTVDTTCPNLQLQVTNTANGQASSYISGYNGTLEIPLNSGNYLVTPVMENAAYFSISPASANVNFPTQPSPLAQDFCLTANGVHPDLEIVIVPVGTARPGFDCRYKVIYKNKGTITQSGGIQFNYNDSVLDFVSSNPSISLQSTNLLVLDYDELGPFETGYFILTFNANSPIETPPLNSGDLLNFTATIISGQIDEMPDDNIFALNQTATNSFDPNDKICLEGATITPEMVGKYVHYFIRFENTGTANAENIVVKDLIDLTKFDVSSLIPLDGSHEFVTRINGNKVEFIFENINLPFDDANNDGYVAFKIKTKPTLVLGDTFSNTASIYFDYNFPIVTEPAVTAITALAKQDFVFDSYFRIYPNPASDVLKIESKQNIEVQSISIYNTLGQLVLVVPNAKTTKAVDVSGLQTGNYFIKIISDKGTSNTKFIKN